ncbi:MAG: hypothetical protein ACOX9R_10125 [Armatimonadota bacterium]
MMVSRLTVSMVMVCAALVVLAGSPADAQRERTPMDLLDALGTGQIDATFYGNGDQSVRARIRRSAFGPEEVVVSPGTQFWAQREGVQGMTTLGWVPIDLTRRHIAYVTIPTACTNYDLPAPTTQDRMNPVCCPEPRMAVLSEYVGRAHPPRPVAQIAVWAIANNPRWDEIAGAVEARVAAETPEERAATAEAWRQQAADLMRGAGINPLSYRVFR